MPNCQMCNASTASDARFCSACGVSLDRSGVHPGQNPSPASAGISSLFAHIPHPHIHRRKTATPKATVEHLPESGHLLSRFNNFLAVRITDAVGTMWCAYAFAALALVSLPEAIKGGTGALITWLAQTFIQLVLLSIIIVGQKVASQASDQRAVDTYNDAEAILHEAVQIQHHLAVQDASLQRLINALCERGGVERSGSTQPQDRPA